MRLHSGFEGRKARLEMISLLDVMLLILVFFVYSIFSMSVHRGLKVNLPRVWGRQEPGESILITVSADNTLALNGAGMKEEDLIREAVSRFQERGFPVLISADRAASFGTAIELLQELHDSGVSNVSFQVKGKSSAHSLPEKRDER